MPLRKKHGSTSTLSKSDTGEDERQLRVYTKWINNKLKGTNLQVKSLPKDMENGVVLLKLLEILSGKQIPGKIHQKASRSSHRSQNLALAFAFMKDEEQLPIVHVSAGKIQEGDEKHVLDLIWQLIMRYQITTAPQGSKSLLLDWLRGCLPDKQIENLTTDWKDGFLLSSLVNFCDSSLIIDHLWLDSDEALENVASAMQIAEEHFNIPQLLKPEDFVCEKPDENCIMTYLSYFYNGENSPGQKMLLEWIREQTEKSVANFADAWIDGKMLGLLVHKTSMDEFDESNGIEGGGNTAACKSAMELADKLLGIEMSLEPAQFSDPSLNPVLRMLYLLQFYFSNLHAKVHELHIPEDTGIGATAWLDITLQEGSTKQVEASVKGKATGDVPTQVNQIESEKYRIQFDAEIPDMYFMHVSVGSMRVKGSPFPVDMTPPDPQSTALTNTVLPKKVGLPVILTLSSKKLIRGTFTADSSGENGDEIPNLVEKVSSNEYTVSFIPLQPEVCNVDIRLDGMHVKGSPFTFPLDDLIQPEMVKVGKPVRCPAGDPVIIPIDTSAAGKDKLSAKCEGEVFGDIEVRYNPPEDPTEISFTPFEEDTYKVSIYYGSTEVLGSPLEINISDEPPDAEKVKLTHPPSGSMNIGTRIKIGFDASEAGCGNMTATCVGKNCGDVKIDISETAQEEYLLSFTPPESDIYSIEVLWSGKPVPGSPFNLNLIPKNIPIPSKCKLIGFPQPTDILLTDEELGFQVDTTEAGTGYLDVVIKVRNEEMEDDRVSLISTGTRGSEVTNMELDHESDEELPPIHEEDEDQKIAGQEVQKEPGSEQANAAVPHGDERMTEEGYLRDAEELDPIARLIIEPTKDNPKLYNVTYVPVQGGKHIMDIYWSDMSISNSPMSITVFDPQLVQYNEPIAVKIKTVYKRKNLKVKLQKRDGTTLKHHVKMEKLSTGNYVLVFTPNQPDVYLMHIKAKGKPIKGSPFVVKYFKPVIPEEKLQKVKVSFPPGQLFIGQPVTITIEVPDHSMLDNLTVTQSGATKGTPAVKLERKKVGQMAATLVPGSVGEEDVEVKIDGKPVPGSPFCISVQQKQETVSVERSMSLDEQRFVVGEPSKLRLVCGDLGEGDLQVLCKPSTSADIEVSEDAAESKVYWATVLPKKSGKVNLIMRYGGSDISGSPFTVNFMPRGYAKKCMLLPPSDYPQDPNDKEKTFCVSTKGAGKGKITAVAKSITNDKLVDVKVEQHSKHLYHISFIPTEGLNYMLTVRFDDVDINGSPYKILLGNPSHCRVEGDALVKLWTGRSNVFYVDAVNAGPGELDVSVEQEDEEKAIESQVAKTDDFSYKVSFEPTAKGIHWVTVKWHDTNIPGSPFKVMCRHPLRANQLSVVEPVSITHDGKRAEMVVQVQESIEEDDKLAVLVRNANGEEFEGEVCRKSDDSYAFSIQPPEIGEYTVCLFWAGEHIAGSPFNVISVPAPSPSDFIVKAVEGEAGLLILSVTGPDLSFRYGTLSASVESAMSGEIPMQLNQISNTVSAVQFKPPNGDNYQLAILYDDKNIQGSPFNLVSTNAAQCYHKGRALSHACINQPNKFSVFTENAGPGDLRVSIEAEIDNERDVLLVPDITPRSNNANVYDVSYTPNFTGYYKISAFWDVSEIPDSPFHVVCCDPTRYSISDPPKEASLGKPFKFGVKEVTPSPDYENLEVFARDKNHVHYTGKVDRGNDRNYLCTVQPPALGKYVVHVQCNGFDISGSPFKFRNMPAPVADKVVVSGPGIKDGSTGEKGTFEIDISQAGHGFVTLKVQGPKSGFNINLTDSKKDKKILAEYNPVHIGKYYISVLWSGDHVPNSPFSVNIKDSTDPTQPGQGVTMQSVIEAD